MNATVTDFIGVDVVFGNITKPDGSNVIIIMEDLDLDTIFNGTFTDTVLVGLYNVTFFANDTSDNINYTEIHRTIRRRPA